ncbi:MAG: hypothetical protein GX587_11260 [Bacteroidales bacterium]|nr:hypothetical protein [Bacteroidales bacterium]
MIKVSDGLFKVTNKEIRKMKASDFSNGDRIYITDSKSGNIKYTVELEKGNYKTFALKSKVMDADTFKYLITRGSSKGFRPEYIDDFLNR